LVPEDEIKPMSNPSDPCRIIKLPSSILISDSFIPSFTRVNIYSYARSVISCAVRKQDNSYSSLILRFSFIMVSMHTASFRKTPSRQSFKSTYLRQEIVFSKQISDILKSLIICFKPSSTLLHIRTSQSLTVDAAIS